MRYHWIVRSLKIPRVNLWWRRWLQRRGTAVGNYGDLPLWDLLFGTFRNPRDFAGEVGFDSPADRRFAKMLAFADVNAPAQGKGSRGVGEVSPARSMA